MSESEIVLPLDETIWDYVEGMEGSIGISVSEKKTLDLLGALYDIYHVSKEDIKEAQELIIGLTALLVAAPIGQAEQVWQELQVKDSMKNFELQVKDVLDEGNE
jgi:hypothetical protein